MIMKKLCFLFCFWCLHIFAQDSIYSKTQDSKEDVTEKNSTIHNVKNQKNASTAPETIEPSDSDFGIYKENENFTSEKIENSNSGFVPQDYFVNASSLIVRSGPGKNFEKIGTLSRNEQITAIGLDHNWIQINFNGTYGYINKDFLSTVSLDSEETSVKKDLGFIETYLGSIIILTLLFVAPEVIQRRNPDRRFKTGIRQDKVPEFIMWKKLILAAVISLPVALIGGIICGIF